ncbi:DUF1697 domain-containing protein [Thalassotalea castellviae]|uniref:DUF1697 domain-containing protein n=1 Tax=Thalassotalea castellviae TaxID=3075612 RepID=A0ABU2ZXE0_9GAMM|nr:DUF1697 domain-containing protein [Thalassotalea sp. W431]MDT0602603.1 DUF1697 domain-containing protein [Thalassotalea sp. W431]
MQKYIAFLRGINVSGQKKINMADLVKLCQRIGFNHVSTYIQSGNICFSHANNDKQYLINHLQVEIKQQYGFDVPVIILTKDELDEAYRNLPFKQIDIENQGNQVLLSFLNEQPQKDKIDQLLAYVNPPEKLTIADQIIYLHCPNGYGKSKLSNNFIENKLKLVATTRNLKTINKLISILSH